MFRFVDRAIAPHHKALEAAIHNVPQAHARAEESAVGVLHAHLAGVAEEHGIPASALTVTPDRRVTFTADEAGRQGEDVEYGTETDPPNPVLRLAAKRAVPHLRSVYNNELRKGLGF